MPNPRQQDHKLNKDKLMTYRCSVVQVEVQKEKNIFSASRVGTSLNCLCISVVLPKLKKKICRDVILPFSAIF